MKQQILEVKMTPRFETITKSYVCPVCGETITAEQELNADGRAWYDEKLCNEHLDSVVGDHMRGVHYNEQKPESATQAPLPVADATQIKAGDWVKYGTIFLQVIEPIGKGKTSCRTLHGTIMYPCTSYLTKASPSEAVIQIGCLKGMVRPVSTNSIHLWFHLVNNKDESVVPSSYQVAEVKMSLADYEKIKSMVEVKSVKVAVDKKSIGDLYKAAGVEVSGVEYHRDDNVRVS